MNIAVIPARGGSKRLPRKNIRPFLGKPMIAHSISSAIESGLFDRVIVSTDDAEIEQVARDVGAEVPFRRPSELSDDHTGTTEVVAHCVEYLQSQSTTLSAVCCIYATAPFIRGADLRAGLTLLKTGRWEFVFSATSFAHPIWRSFALKPGGEVEPYFPEHVDTRSQDLPHALHDAAQFYWGRPQAWLNRAPIFDSNSTAIVLPRWRVQDIDTEEDWIHAESMAPYVADAR